MAFCALSVAPVFVQAAEPLAQVLTFSPQGKVPAAQQVRVTFSEPMLPLGKVSAPGPFDMDCALAGDAHWVDGRTWVMDLKEQTLDGQACVFRIKPGLQSLAGHAVGEPLTFRFQLPVLPDDARRTIQTVLPSADWYLIAEDQVFLLGYSLPLGSTPPDVRCEAQGHAEAPAIHLPSAVRDELKRPYGWAPSPDDRLEAIRCPFVFAPGSKVTLRLVRPNLKPAETHFQVRPLPAATLDCKRMADEGGCAAGFPISLHFNAAIAESVLREIRLEGAPDPLPRQVQTQAADLYRPGSSVVTFAPGLRPDAEYRIHWPSQGFEDVSGRPLQRESLPASIRTLPVLGLAYLTVPAVSVRPLQADNPVPVFLQGDAAAPDVREMLVGTDSDAPAADLEVLRWMGLAGSGNGLIRHFWERTGRYWGAEGDAKAPPFQGGTPLALQRLGTAPQPSALRASVQLKGAGLHVLQLRALDNQGNVGPVHDSAALLLTRLAVHLKIAKENSAVWVTRLDDGVPVADVALRAYDCHGNVAWQGRSDAQGLASIDRQSIARCNTYPDMGVTVVARYTWPDGERDVSVANSRWNPLLDAASYGVHEGNSAVQAHTVLDRSLFKPGETVSMRHVLRRESDLGLVQLDAGELPGAVKVIHRGSGKEWPVSVNWAKPGDGDSSFELPQDAPLGNYTVLLELRSSAPSYDRPYHATAQFAVEAFRLPAMQGDIVTPQPKLTFGAAPTLQLALRYADGGAAQRWPVTLKVYAQGQGYRRPAVLDDYPEARALADDLNKPSSDDERGQVLLDSRSLDLDMQGRAQVTLPALPTRGQPYLLHAELSYLDPNGEAQTVSQDFNVQPSLRMVGVRTLGSVAVNRPVQLLSLVLDENGVPLAAQPVRVGASRREGFNATTVDDLGEVCQGLTDAKGQLLCHFVPSKAGTYQFSAAAPDAQGRLATSHSRVAYVGDGRQQAQPLFVNVDKAQYRTGDTALITVASPFPRSRVWLTLERQGVLESRVITLDGAETRIPLPIRREWAGNVAVSLLALDASGIAMPTPVATGITELAVSTEAHALKISVKPDRQRYQPRDNANVRIHVATPDGKPLPASRRLSFVAVDEALLSLKDNPSWQLLARMLRPRQHLVQTTSGLVMNPPVDEAAMQLLAEGDLLDRIRRAGADKNNVVTMLSRAVAAPAPVAAKAIEGADIETVVVTGARARREDAQPEVTRTLLDSLLYWQADVAVDDRGDAVVSFPIKDSLTRFRLVAVASAGDEDFGTGMAALDVTKDLQLTAGLPPQVREGDRFAALVTVRNTSGEAIMLDASARVSGHAALPAKALRLAAGESRQIGWDVRVPVGVTALNWTFAAKERGHPRRQDMLAITQQVEPAVPVTVQAATLAQVNGSFDVPAFGVDSADARGARVAVRLLPSLAGNLGGVQAWLAAYPYRCLEQTASRAIGMHDRQAWDAVMAELPRYLDEDGLANYFPRTPSQPWPGSDTLTAYLLDLSSASGWPIPRTERSRMLAALQRFAAGQLKRSFWSPRDDRLARQLAAMATLARHGQLDAAQLDAVRIDPDEWTSAMLIDWLTVLRKTQFQPTGLGTQATQAMTENALRARLTYQGRRMGFSTESNDYWWWLMNNGDVDSARLLLAVADLPGWKADLPRLLTGLLARQQKHGAWATTNANAWGTLAVDAFARLMESVPVAGQTHITLGRRDQIVSWAANDRKSFDAALDRADDALRIRHDGVGAPWASVEVRAAVPLKEPRFAGFSLTRSVTPVQQKAAGHWHVGDVLRVRLSIRAQADMSWVVVNDPVPAGASLLGAGLGRDSAAAQAGEQRSGNAWLLYQARDFTSFKSFYRYVPRGEFTLEYTVRLNNPGQFALPPTRVEAMYAPEVFGEAPNEVFGIEP